MIKGPMEAEVRDRLMRKLSPEQVGGALRRKTGEGTSRTSLYNYIQAGKQEAAICIRICESTGSDASGIATRHIGTSCPRG